MKKLTTEEIESSRLSVEAFKEAPKLPVVLVLDNLRSMHNVGSAFRTADAFTAEKIVLCGITAQPPHREIHKTALGATDSVAWEHSESTAEALQKLQQQGYQIVLVEQTSVSVPLQHFPFSKEEKYAFVFGNEVFGVSEEAVPFAQASIEIPQFGTKHSLNVSVSLGIVLWGYLAATQLS